MSLRASAIVALCLVAGACSHATRQAPLAQYLDQNPTYPFSGVVRVGNMLYLSGQIGTDSTGRLVPGGIQNETRQAMFNIQRLLERNGSSMSRVVKCTAMLADMRDWDAMNQVYALFFPQHKPARSAFGATGLALGARVEIECMATAG